MAQLRAVVPAGLTVFANVNVIEGEVTLVIPDVAVVDTAHATPDGLGVAPSGVELIIEVTSPSTRRNDLKTKRDLYEGWSVPYVVVDRRTAPFVVTIFGELPEYARGLQLTSE